MTDVSSTDEGGLPALASTASPLRNSTPDESRTGWLGTVQRLLQPKHRKTLLCVVITTALVLGGITLWLFSGTAVAQDRSHSVASVERRRRAYRSQFILTTVAAALFVAALVTFFVAEALLGPGMSTDTAALKGGSWRDLLVAGVPILLLFAAAVGATAGIPAAVAQTRKVVDVARLEHAHTVQAALLIVAGSAASLALVCFILCVSLPTATTKRYF